MSGGFVSLQNVAPLTARGVLSDTSATTMLSASGDNIPYVLGILLTNHSGGAVTPVVDLWDGSTATIIRDNKSLADQASEIVELPAGFILMNEDDLLRVTAASGVSWVVSYGAPRQGLDRVA